MNWEKNSTFAEVKGTNDTFNEFKICHCPLFFSHIEGAFDIAVAGTLKETYFASTLQEYNKKIEKLLPFASSSHIKMKSHFQIVLQK